MSKTKKTQRNIIVVDGVRYKLIPVRKIPKGACFVDEHGRIYRAVRPRSPRRRTPVQEVFDVRVAKALVHGGVKYAEELLRMEERHLFWRIRGIGERNIAKINKILKKEYGVGIGAYAPKEKR